MTIVMLFLTLIVPAIVPAIAVSPMRPPNTPSKKGHGECCDDK